MPHLRQCTHVGCNAYFNSMKYLIFILAFVCLFSCSRNEKFETYSKIIDSADQFRYYIRNNDTFTLTKKVIISEQVQSLKNILKRNIEPELQQKFIAYHKIEIYRKGDLQGALLISGSKEYPYVNFTNGNFGFGFRLTYGIGMSL